MMVSRFDGSVPLLSKPEKTPEGYLKVSAPIAKEGIMTYRLKDGTTRRELVTKDTLFDKESISTLKLKPVTNRHPKEMLLDSKTVKRRNVGTVGETIEPLEDKLVATFIVSDQSAIDSIENGRVELSPGYKTVLDFTPGTWMGQPYDAIQKRREYNHLALVDKARGGAELKINMDSEEEIGLSVEKNDIGDNNNNEPNKNGDIMKKEIKVDGVTVEVDASVAAHFDTMQANLDAAEEQSKQLKKDNAELQEKVNTFDSELKTRVDEAVTARVALVSAAKDLFNTDSDEDKKFIENMDSMDNNSLKKAIIVKVQPSAKEKLDSKDVSDVYIDSRFDAAMEIAEEKKKEDEENKKKEALKKGRSKMSGDKENKNDGDDDKVGNARESMMKADSEAWMEEEKK